MLNIENFQKTGIEKEIIDTGQMSQNRIVTINWCDIKDKLIRLTAKYTDRYASDIIIDIIGIEEFINNIDRENEKSWLFGFRASGVDHFTFVSSKDKKELKSEYRSIWKLDFNIIDNYKVQTSLYQVEYRGKE